MVRVVKIILGSAVLASLLCAADAQGAPKKPAKAQDAAIPAGYVKIATVDYNTKSFTLAGEQTKYLYTDKTPGVTGLMVGGFAKVAVKEGTKDQVTKVDVLPPPKKPKAKANPAKKQADKGKDKKDDKGKKKPTDKKDKQADKDKKANNDKKKAADKAKKTPDPAIPAGYVKIAAVDYNTKSFTLTGDETKYLYTDKTPGVSGLMVGSFAKVTLTAGTKDQVSKVDVMAPPKKPKAKAKPKDKKK
jgi:hypothetical protein